MRTPDPKPPSQGGELPSRHRPVLSNLAKDTTEADLWEFDDDLEMDLPGDSAASIEVLPNTSGLEIPAIRERKGSKHLKEKSADSNDSESTAIPALQFQAKIQRNVGKIPQSSRSLGPGQVLTERESEFEDLDEWDDAPVAPDFGNITQELAELRELPESVVETSPPVEKVEIDQTLTETVEIVAPSASDFDDELSPPSAGTMPVSLRPRLGLSTVERVGIVALVIVLLGVGLAAYLFSVNRLPRESAFGEKVDFPLKGGLVEVDQASSYWRAPVLNGPNPDVVRRGTKFIPVVELKVSSSSGAVRAVFRDEENQTVGDSITRQADGGGVINIAATAGFDDMGMHAAYRAGGGEPWTVEILEGPSVDAPSTDFKRLFKMNISIATR